jgi:hypothetical protein
MTNSQNKSNTSVNANFNHEASICICIDSNDARQLPSVNLQLTDLSTTVRV